MVCLGLDIGGAHLKISDGTTSFSKAFPLWKSPELLAKELRTLVGGFAPARRVGVTMTGELADCFRTRSEGVEFILSAIEEGISQQSIGIWQTTGEFASVADAREFPELVASANWHALATWAGRVAPAENVLLVDFGSTTTDIIPIEMGTPQPLGRTDVERLASRELVYTGLRRTTLCSITDEVELQGRKHGIAAEHFATTHDVGLILGQISEEPENCDTADGRPATRSHALGRLARMLCADRNVLTEGELENLASQFQEAQLERISQAMECVLNRWKSPPAIWVLAGEGEEILRKMIDNRCLARNSRELVSLKSLFGSAHSKAACAFALSRLSEEGMMWSIEC